MQLQIVFNYPGDSRKLLAFIIILKIRQPRVKRQYLALAGFRRRNSIPRENYLRSSCLTHPRSSEVNDRHKKKCSTFISFEKRKPVRGTVRAISKISEGEKGGQRNSRKPPRGKKIDPIVKTRSMDLSNLPSRI